MTQPEKLLGSDIWQQERPLQRQSKEIAMDHRMGSAEARKAEREILDQPDTHFKAMQRLQRPGSRPER